MLWIGISLLSRLAFAASNVLDSHFRHAKFESAVVQNFCGTLYYLLIVPALFLFVQPQWPHGQDWVWLIASGVLMNLYLLPYYEAMKWGDSSTITSLFTLARIFTPVLAFLIIGEQLSLRQYIGFGVVLAGACLLSFDRAAVRFSFKPVLLMALSGILVALCTVLSKRVYAHMPWLDAFCYILLFSSLTAFAPYLVLGLRHSMNVGVKKFRSYAVPMGLNVGAGLIGNALFNLALSMTLASYVSMIGMFQPFFVMGLGFAARKAGWLQAKESFHPHDLLQKTLAFLVMTGGMIATLWGAH